MKTVPVFHGGVRRTSPAHCLCMAVQLKSNSHCTAWPLSLTAVDSRSSLRRCLANKGAKPGRCPIQTHKGIALPDNRSRNCLRRHFFTSRVQTFQSLFQTSSRPTHPTPECFSPLTATHHLASVEYRHRSIQPHTCGSATRHNDPDARWVAT
jgi:hypothetical protein